MALTFYRLQEETAKVEEHLLDGSFSRAIIACFTNSKADAFENLLEPLQKLLRLSPPVAASLAHPELFSRTVQKLHNKKAVVRGNLLRIIRSICDASEGQGELLRRYGLHDAIERLAENDGAILVRNMAADLLRANEPDNFTGRGPSLDASRFRPGRRTSSSSTTLPLLYPIPPSSSQPPTPKHLRPSTQSTASSVRGRLDSITERNVGRPRVSATPTTATPYRPANRLGGSRLTVDTLNNDPTAMPPGSSGGKSRLPRTNVSHGRFSRPTLATSRREENRVPAGTTSPTPAPGGAESLAAAPTSKRLEVVNPRRRKGVGGVG